MTTLWDSYKNITHPLAEALVAAQYRGVLVDKAARQILIDSSNKRVADTKNRLSDIVGKEFNPNSPKQVNELLYDKLRLPIIYNKDSRPTTNEDALLRLQKRYPEERVLQLIIDYRKDTKLISTFLEAKADADGRMRTSYNPSGTKNFRISSSQNIWGGGMNLQNIPVGKRAGIENIRNIFVAPKGYSFVKCDLSQAETMVVARLLCRFNDYVLWNKYAHIPNFDVHKWGASYIFEKPEELINKHERNVGKIGNHSGNYCAGFRVVQATALKYGVDNMTVSLAKKVIEARKKAMPGLTKWWHAVEMKLRKDRTLTTCHGRRRIFFGRLDDNATIRDAVAFEPQSVVGDNCNILFAKLYQRFKDTPALPVLQVHDEVVVETPDGMIDEVVAAMKLFSQIPLDLNKDLVPLIIPLDISVGINWRDCVDIK